MPKPAQLAADESVELLETTVGGLLERAAARAPEQIALITRSGTETITYTYTELLRRSEQVARALLGRFSPGDRVAIWAPNSAKWMEMEFGAALAGLTLVTVNPALTESEVAYVLQQSRSAGIVHATSFRGNDLTAAVLAAIEKAPDLRHAISLDGWDEFVATADGITLPEVKPSDPVQIQYTSGTTGFPKGAQLHHRGIVNNAYLVGGRMGFTSDGRLLNPMPLFHTGGCVIGALVPVIYLGTHLLVPEFTPELVLTMAAEHGATEMMAVPTMLVALMEHPQFATTDLSALRTVLSGAAVVPGSLVRRIESTLGVQFGVAYGLTEASPLLTMTRPADPPEDKGDSIGQPLPQTKVKIVDPATGETVEIGEVGEICAHSYGVMLGYFDMPDATREAIDSDGWLHTGDLGAMDDRGYLSIEGRLKDMIIRGGENIYPREIEDHLVARDDIAEASVVGIPDEKWGEVVAAFVRPSGSTTLDFTAIEADLRIRLAAHKLPKHWVQVASFPMTASGKIQKYALRDQFMEAQP